VADSRMRRLTLAATLTALTCVCSLIAIPNPLLPSVPFTLQVLAVCLAGMLQRPRLAFASLALYLLLGVLGLPVFAGGASGPAPLVGATGGFLWGFPFQAALISWLTGERPSWPRAVGAATAGILLLYAFGLAGLHLLAHLPLRAATVLGVLTFLPWDLLKAVVAVALAARLRGLLQRPLQV